MKVGLSKLTSAILGPVAGAAALVAVPAAAATIVQTATNASPAVNPATFSGFDRNLGRLDSVTLEISGTENRLFSAIYPTGATDPITVDWAIDGDALFRLRDIHGGTHQDFLLPIAGSGQVTVTKSGWWGMTTYGSASYSIDPSFIPGVDDDPYNFADMKIYYHGPGFYDSSDTTLTTSAPIYTNLASANCVRLDTIGSGEESCNRYGYRLTYDYTPAALLGVPEPATWALMILGFGTIGGQLRRKARAARVAHA